MAKNKGGRLLVKLLSTAQTGFFYTTTKNPAKTTEKLFLRKYDPIVRQHVWFKEAKLESGRKR